MLLGLLMGLGVRSVLLVDRSCLQSVSWSELYIYEQLITVFFMCKTIINGEFLCHLSLIVVRIFVCVLRIIILLFIITIWVMSC